MKQAAEIGTQHCRNEDFENETILEGRPIFKGNSNTMSLDMLEIAYGSVLLNSLKIEP